MKCWLQVCSNFTTSVSTCIFSLIFVRASINSNFFWQNGGGKSALRLFHFAEWKYLETIWLTTVFFLAWQWSQTPYQFSNSILIEKHTMDHSQSWIVFTVILQNHLQRLYIVLTAHVSKVVQVAPEPKPQHAECREWDKGLPTSRSCFGMSSKQPGERLLKQTTRKSVYTMLE